MAKPKKEKKKGTEAPVPSLSSLTGADSQTNTVNTAGPSPSITSTGSPTITMLPITQEQLKNPDQYSDWLYSHSPLLLESIFKTLDLVSPTDRIKILLHLFTLTSTHRPFKPIESSVNKQEDNTKVLADLLAVSPVDKAD